LTNLAACALSCHRHVYTSRGSLIVADGCWRIRYHGNMATRLATDVWFNAGFKHAPATNAARISYAPPLAPTLHQ